MAMTWSDWHKAYDDPNSALSARLGVVQQQLRDALDRCVPGPVRLVSVCAGQGHDVIGVLEDHPRSTDVRATLIELDADNVRAARERVAAAGLSNVQILEGDASMTSIYDGLVPADVVLVCGLFGNMSDADIRRTIRHLPMLCAAEASVLWTRGGYLAEQIRAWFVEAGFEEAAFTALPSHGIGMNRFVGSPLPLVTGIRLFTFTSSWTLHATEDTLTIRGLRLHYRAWGEPNKPALVLLHGQCRRTRHTAAGAAGTHESDDGAALARALRGGRVRRAAGSTTPWPAERAGADDACAGGGPGVRTTSRP